MAPDSHKTMVERDDPENSSGGGVGRILVMVIAVAALLAAVAFATGLLNLNTSGDLEAPQVSVTGGELPKVEVDAADISVESKSVMVEVPEVRVEKPADQDRP